MREHLARLKNVFRFRIAVFYFQVETEWSVYLYSYTRSYSYMYEYMYTYTYMYERIRVHTYEWQRTLKKVLASARNIRVSLSHLLAALIEENSISYMYL